MVPVGPRRLRLVAVRLPRWLRRGPYTLRFFRRCLRRRAPSRPAARRLRLRDLTAFRRRRRRFGVVAAALRRRRRFGAEVALRLRRRRLGAATAATRRLRRRCPSLAAVRRPRPRRLVKRPFLFLLRAIDELLLAWSPFRTGLRRRLTAMALASSRRRRLAGFTFAEPLTRMPVARPRDGLTNMMGIASPCSSLDPRSRRSAVGRFED